MATPTPPRPLRLIAVGLCLFAAYALARHALAGFYPIATTQDVAAYEWWLTGANALLSALLLVVGWKALGWATLWNSPGRPVMTLILGVGVVLSCGYSWSDQIMAPMTADNDRIRVAALALGLGMAVAEEIGFRGLIYRAAETRCGRNCAILVSAVLFTVLHLDQRLCAASPRTALGGLALSIARAKGLSLGNLILIHFAAEAAWALFLPLPGPLDAPKELTSAAVNLLVCVVLWRMPDPPRMAVT